MMSQKTSADYASELSRKLKRHRIDYPMTQQELAEKTGLSLRTIQYFENGKEIKLDSFVRILIALDLADNLEMLVPDPDNRPSAYLDLEKGRRKLRVRSPKTDRYSDRKEHFVWGDEV